MPEDMKKKKKIMKDGKEVEVDEDYEEEKQNTSLPEGLAAKRFILQASGTMTEEQVSHINSIADADLLITHFGLDKKNAAPEPPKKGFVGTPIPFKDNPDPRKNKAPLEAPAVVPYSVEELMDPLQTDDSRLNRYQDDENVRIIRHYSDSHLEGRLI
jgi:hypothetical protein